MLSVGAPLQFTGRQALTSSTAILPPVNRRADHPPEARVLLLKACEPRQSLTNALAAAARIAEAFGVNAHDA